MPRARSPEEILREALGEKKEKEESMEETPIREPLEEHRLDLTEIEVERRREKPAEAPKTLEQPKEPPKPLEQAPPILREALGEKEEKPSPSPEDLAKEEFREVLEIAQDSLRQKIIKFMQLSEEERRKRVEKFLDYIRGLFATRSPVDAGILLMRNMSEYDEFIVYYLYLFRPEFKIYAARLLVSIAQMMNNLSGKRTK